MKLRPKPRTKLSRRPIRPEAPQPVAAPTFADPSTRPPKRRRSRTALIVAPLVLIVVAAVAIAAWRTMPQLRIDQVDTVSNDPTPTFLLRLEHGYGVGPEDVEARVDGKRIPSSRVAVSDGGLVRIDAQFIEDGAHELHVTVHGAGVLQRTLEVERSLTIDTTPPPAKLLKPAVLKRAAGYVPADVAPITTRPAALTIDAERGSRITVTTSGGSQQVSENADALGSDRVLKVVLPEGEQTLTMDVRDAAGNVTSVRRRVLVDTTGPKVTGAVPRIVKSNTLGVVLAAHDPNGVELRVVIDGTPVESGTERTVTTPAPAEATRGEAGDGGSRSADSDTTNGGDEQGSSGEDGDGSDGQDGPLPVAAKFRLALEDPLFEGRHAMEVIATDSVGAVTRTKFAFVVDSTESLNGASGLRPSARGGDVVELQRALIQKDGANRAKLAKELQAKVYGPNTAAAVRSYQRARGVEADGVAGSETLAVLTLKVVVDLSAKRLTLYRMGAVVKSYGVAVGSPQYPTPTGSFSIQNMQKDPTWTPPDSDWAKDAKPIGPGPDNPLGTRWMAINGTVGIHGTNNPASIGYSVSHGCIRMRIPEVEELFELVRVGTPVEVV